MCWVDIFPSQLLPYIRHWPGMVYINAWHILSTRLSSLISMWRFAVTLNSALILIQAPVSLVEALHRRPPHSILLLFLFDNLFGSFSSFTSGEYALFLWLWELQNLSLEDILSSSSYCFSFFLPEYLPCQRCGVMGKRDNVVSVGFASWSQKAQSLGFISSFC